MKHKDASTDIQHTTTKVQKGTMVLVGVWHRRTNMVWNRQKVKSYSTFILASCKKDYFLSFNKKHWICFSFQFKCFYYLHLGLFLLPRKLAFYPEISGSESFPLPNCDFIISFSSNICSISWWKVMGEWYSSS